MEEEKKWKKRRNGREGEKEEKEKWKSRINGRGGEMEEE
jgi:hypothetical protein